MYTDGPSALCVTAHSPRPTHSYAKQARQVLYNIPQLINWYLHRRFRQTDRDRPHANCLIPLPSKHCIVYKLHISAHKGHNPLAPKHAACKQYSVLMQTVAVRTALFWVVMQRVLVISYRRFGTTYGFHPQGSRSTDRLSRNVGKNHHYSLCNNPEERSS
jgi:hypothetical protein